MRKDAWLIVIGVLVFGTPFLGVPALWKDIVSFVLGGLVVLMAMAYRLQHRRDMRTQADTVHLDHNPYQEADVRPV